MEIHRDCPCHGSNCRKGRTAAVKYLVVHYVGAAGGAAANAKYYGSTPGVNASAHYFVGHASEGAAVWASVAEGDTAWHVGAKKYVHPDCRNANSIGVELCCHRREDGSWYFDRETIDAAAALCRDIAGRYGLDADHVLRHYDVTGKKCPAPWVDDRGAWEEFKRRIFEEEEENMKLYSYVAEMPVWAREAAAKAIHNGYIKMDGAGAVGVWECSLQPLVWLERAGILDRPAVDLEKEEG